MRNRYYAFKNILDAWIVISKSTSESFWGMSLQEALDLALEHGGGSISFETL